MQRSDGEEITYNLARLSGVNVYRESNRRFSEGDRIQFRAPFSEHRIANGELGSIGRITEEELMVALDNGREVSLELEKFRHIDHGYAVTAIHRKAKPWIVSLSTPMLMNPISRCRLVRACLV